MKKLSALLAALVTLTALAPLSSFAEDGDFATDCLSLFAMDESASEGSTVYFDNSEAQWEYVIVLYADAEDALHSLGNIIADENGQYAISLPADAVEVRFQNYWPGQPESEAPEGGFIGTDFLPVEDGATYDASSAGGSDDGLTVGYDINGDGEVNTKDLTRLMKYIAGEDVPTAANDVNGDGKVDTKDLTRLMKYIAGATETPTAYDEAYSKLADWIKKNGVASNGTYGYSSEEYTTDYGSVYSLTFVYRESDSSISVTVFYTEGDEHVNRYGLMDSTSVYLSPQTQNTDSIDYQFIYDNASYRDMSCYVIGTQSKSKFYAREELTYSKAEFGDWDENEVLSYLNVALTDSIYQADAFLAENNAGMSFSDLGIVLYNSDSDDSGLS